MGAIVGCGLLKSFQRKGREARRVSEGKIFTYLRRKNSIFGRYPAEDAVFAPQVFSKFRSVALPISTP